MLDPVPLRVAGGARPDGAARRDDAARALERLEARAVHEREHQARLRLVIASQIRKTRWRDASASNASSGGINTCVEKRSRDRDATEVFPQDGRRLGRTDLLDLDCFGTTAASERHGSRRACVADQADLAVGSDEPPPAVLDQRDRCRTRAAGFPAAHGQQVGVAASEASRVRRLMTRAADFGPRRFHDAPGVRCLRPPSQRCYTKGEAGVERGRDRRRGSRDRRDAARAYEVFVRGRLKFRVGQIVFLAFSKDGAVMGIGFPKDWRAAAVESEPEKFFAAERVRHALQLGACAARRA